MNLVRSSHVRHNLIQHLLIVNPKNGRPASMLSQETYEIVRYNAELLDSTIIYSHIT